MDLRKAPSTIPIIPIMLLVIPLNIFISKPFNMEKQRKQQIVLIIPYIDYSRYPSKYSSWKEIFYPQSSVFVNTCKKEFYSNWNGEAIINFKWKAFGRIYYFIIWLIFMVFLVCFTIASYPTNSITQKVHLSAYLSATIASIYWIKYDDIPDWALSISCILLDLKFLLFFRIFEYFGVYFAIIFGVAKHSLNEQNPRNQNSLSPWAPKPTTENTILFIIMASLVFSTKAEVLEVIELFYLLPHQRRWRSWFPEVIYCRVDVDKTRIYIKEAIKKGTWNMDDWPEMKHKILTRLSVDDVIIDLAG
ncbi:hypothetical protein C1646_768604 [Rhizophagus diaphanus]|nr:hypothetical protein C1646_768604 [Rhizophagus diaphanus] [Rhizophagus sp. MUCL 43196]